MNTRLWTVAVVLLAALNVSNASPDHGASQKTLANHDARKSAGTVGKSNAADPGAVALREKVPGAKVSRDKLLGVPRLVQGGKDFLTGPTVRRTTAAS